MSLTPPTPEEIKRFRRERGGWSQRALAETLGVSTRIVEEWEAGRTDAPTWLRFAFAALAAELPAWGVPLGPAAVEGLRRARTYAAASPAPIVLEDLGEAFSVGLKKAVGFTGVMLSKVDMEADPELVLRKVKLVEGGRGQA